MADLRLKTRAAMIDCEGAEIAIRCGRWGWRDRGLFCTGAAIAALEPARHSKSTSNGTSRSTRCCRVARNVPTLNRVNSSPSVARSTASHAWLVMLYLSIRFRLQRSSTCSAESGLLREQQIGWRLQPGTAESKTDCQTVCKKSLRVTRDISEDIFTHRRLGDGPGPGRGVLYNDARLVCHHAAH